MFLRFPFWTGVIGLLLISCLDNQVNRVQEKAIVLNKEGTLRIEQKEQTLAEFDIEIADTPYERQTGMMYRQHMENNQGMLFVFDQAQPLNFYMKNTPLALDLIFLNEHLEVIHIHNNAIPNNESSIPSIQPAKYVLELLAGTSKNIGLALGDQVNYVKN